MKFRTSKIIGVTVFESFQNWFHGKLSCKKILKFPHCAFDSIWCRWFTNDVYLSEKLNLDFCDAISDVSTSQCSRNFQNVKLRLDVAEIWLFYRHSDFAWNHTLANSNGPKMSFMAILEMLNFGKFGTWKLLKFIRNQNSQPLKLQKMTLLDCLNSPNFNFT